MIISTLILVKRNALRLSFAFLAIGLASCTAVNDELAGLGAGAAEGDVDKAAATTESAAGSGASMKTQLMSAVGETIYQNNCATCHNGRVSKAPPVTLLQIMSSDSILLAMNEGVMKSQSAQLTADEKSAVVTYLTGGDGTESFPPAPQCEGDSLAFDLDAQPDTKGWGVDFGNGRKFGSNITDINAGNVDQLELKWAFAFPGAVRARSNPTTAAGALFVGSQDGSVYALDQKSGCVRWSFRTVAEVRSGIVVAPWSKDNETSLSYFTDLIGNVYAVNTFTGELVWRDRADDHPSLTLTAAPVLHEDRLIVPLSALEVTEAADPNYACCTFRGGVAIYDAQSGKLLSTAYTIAETPVEVGKNAVGTPMIAPSGSPVWNTPSLDEERGVVYVGTGENYSSPANGTSDAILALSLKTGEIVWQQQMTAGDAWNMGCESEDKSNCPPENGPDYDFGAATILATHSSGKQMLLAGQKSGEAFGLDPNKGGEIVWRRKLGRGGIQGGVHFGMAVDGDTLYVPISDFDGGPRWPGVAKPGMYALDIATGELLWSAPSPNVCTGQEYCQPGLSAAVSAIPGAVLAGGMDGRLRAYDEKSGKVLWDYDAVKEYQATSGVTAQGGSFGGAAGPVLKDDMLFVNSGYGIYFHMPGNVLLAFGLPDKN